MDHAQEALTEPWGPHSRGVGALRRTLAVLSQGCDLLDQVDLDAVEDRDLLETTARLDRELTRLEARRARLVRVIDARRAFRLDGCVSAGGWVRLRTSRHPGEASRIARAARRLGWLADTRRAFEAGEVTSGHVDQIVTAATPRRRQAILDHEATLVDLAREASPVEVARACGRVADLVDRDGSQGGCGPDPRRRLFLSQTFEQLWELRATLDKVTGERLHALLLAVLPADDPQVAIVDRRTPAQQRHDAFDVVVRAAEEHPNLPSVHGAPPHVLLTLDLAALTPLHALADKGDETGGTRGLGEAEVSGGTQPLGATGEPRLGTGTHITLQQAVDLLQRAKLTPVLQMGPYRPVAVGRTQRTLPGWLRPLLAAIHVHCRGPGCDRPIPWTEAAHSGLAWQYGGDTDLEKTLPLCSSHHKLVDEDGWSADLDPDTAIVTWTSPDGTTTIDTHPPP